MKEKKEELSVKQHELLSKTTELQKLRDRVSQESKDVLLKKRELQGLGGHVIETNTVNETMENVISPVIENKGLEKTTPILKPYVEQDKRVLFSRLHTALERKLDAKQIEEFGVSDVYAPARPLDEKMKVYIKRFAEQSENTLFASESSESKLYLFL
ncbi:hypothetical protein [Bacillus thuringiensis]|uniref:hypothetical protein n=1 Tax=Bacillus thuringiensis TaxID=1428 RepID=UPI003DA0FC58